MEQKHRYFSFLLRVWLAGNNHQPQWHASLEDTRTGDRKGFPSLEALYTYLKNQTRSDIEDKEVVQND